MEHIVVGVDETPEAAAALRWAAEEATRRDARITALLAWDFLSQHRVEQGETFTPRYTEADARAALDAIVERTLGADGAGVERRVVCDLPAHALLDAAAEADLLVIGTRDLHRIRRVLAGSISSRCRRHPPCSMAIVHGDGRVEIVQPASRAAVG